MLCLSLASPSIEGARRALCESARFADLVELRLDLLPPGAARELVRASPLPVIATCRRKSEGGAFDGNAREALAVLEQAVEAGARYVDLDIRTARTVGLFTTSCNATPAVHRVLSVARLILSYHASSGVSPNLRQIIRRLLSARCRFAKIAVESRSATDAARLLAVAQAEIARARKPAPRLIAIAMGNFGIFSRILYRRFGAPWCYALPPSKKDLHVTPTAPGQLDIRALRKEYRAHRCTKRTGVFAIIGTPLTHTRSPAYFNALFARNKLDAVFIPLQLAKIDEFPRIARLLRLRGASVTMPHKEEIIRHLREVSPAAGIIGAVNTIVARRGGGYIGYNTDAAGVSLLLRAAVRRLARKIHPHAAGHWGEQLRKTDRTATASLRSDMHGRQVRKRLVDGWTHAHTHGLDWGDSAFLAGRRAIVLGAGGVARAVVYALVRAGATVIVSNRTFARAVSLSSAFGCIPVPWEDRAAIGTDVLVNATSLGMAPSDNEEPYGKKGIERGPSPLPFPAEKLHSGMIVMDCVHTPEETPLVRAARRRHCEVITGVALFKAQARYQWRLFRDALTVPRADNSGHGSTSRLCE